MKPKEENSYRSILRGTSLFGGVQVFNILTGLVRGKLVAIFLGPAGMGISALFSTAGATIQQFASLGLNLAIVKEVSSTRDDSGALAATLAAARRLILLTALLGAIVCFAASPLLSRWSFGNSDYTAGFMLLSAMVFFAIAGAGELSVLQGMRQVKRLSLASLVGGLAGLCIGVPLYAFFGERGIVPALIAVPLSTSLFYLYALRRSNLPRPAPFSMREHRTIAGRLIGLGMVLMAGALLGTLTNFLINTFVRHFGSVDTVGLYQAANSITNQYVGVVFSAMSLDFFPRLTAVASDNRRITAVVNRQIEIVVYILTPLVVALILTAPLIIRLLLTDDFLEIMPLMRWMGLGVLLRGIIYPMGYITFAKDNRRLFFWLEGVTGNLLNLVLSCSLFFFFGIDGLGMSLVASCGLTFFIYLGVNRRQYGYGLSRKAALLIAASLAAGTASFAATMIADQALSIALIAAILIGSAAFGFFNLRRALRNEKKES